MESCNASEPKERQTLMLMYEKLSQKCNQLEGVAEMTERLNKKLNRTEEIPECEVADKSPVIETARNIVELFNLIADRMERQTHIIGNNMESAMEMID